MIIKDNVENNVEDNIEEQADKKEENNKKQEIDEKNKLIKIIMNQTTYNYEESKEKLKFFDNNYMDVIKNYNGIEIKKNNDQELNVINNLNQTIYKEIRNFIKEIK